MPLNDDGDLIRGLGFVALYAAYLEEAVDECLACLFPAGGRQYDRILRHPTGRKVGYLSDRMRGFAPLPEELGGFFRTLEAVSELLEHRNLVVHGQVYATPDGGDVRRSGRRGAAEEAATSAELYELANSMFAACKPLNYASRFALPRLLSAARSTTTQRDFAKEHEEALKEYESAKDAYFNRSAAAASGFAAVYRGNHEANPSLDLLGAVSDARDRWEAAKKMLRDIAMEWARAS